MNYKFKRIVVKVGSSTLTNSSGKLNFTRIDSIVRQLVDLQNSGREVLLVSSGSIAAGMGELGFKEKPASIPGQQACAAVGQGLLIGIYNKFFRQYGERAAQILLTSSDLENRNRYLNAFNTVDSLLSYGVIPVINENDTVATNEIKVGDNDRLSARVAGLVEADLLINLSDVEGLYNGDPSSSEKKLKLISRVDTITDEIQQAAGGRGSKVGTGGMMTKIAAAKIAVNSGVMMIIGPGHKKNIILKLVEMAEKEETDIGTTFTPCSDSLCKRKQWLNYNIPPAGKLKVDAGAAEALKKRGKSLLPGGIKDVEGEFSAGELVIIEDFTGEFARGIVNYSSEEIQQIKGRHSDEISEVLGYYNQAEVVHRDNMVLGGDR